MKDCWLWKECSNEHSSVLNCLGNNIKITYSRIQSWQCFNQLLYLCLPTYPPFFLPVSFSLFPFLFFFLCHYLILCFSLHTHTPTNTLALTHIQTYIYIYIYIYIRKTIGFHSEICWIEKGRNKSGKKVIKKNKKKERSLPSNGISDGTLEKAGLHFYTQSRDVSVALIKMSLGNWYRTCENLLKNGSWHWREKWSVDCKWLFNRIGCQLPGGSRQNGN